MQRHTTSHLENKRGKAFQWGLGGWEAEAYILLEDLLGYIKGLNTMSRLICMIIVAVPVSDSM
jgi:hypothetical protein